MAVARPAKREVVPITMPLPKRSSMGILLALADMGGPSITTGAASRLCRRRGWRLNRASAGAGGR